MSPNFWPVMYRFFHFHILFSSFLKKESEQKASLKMYCNQCSAPFKRKRKRRK